jgi:hypothetical protein
MSIPRYVKDERVEARRLSIGRTTAESDALLPARQTARKITSAAFFYSCHPLRFIKPVFSDYAPLVAEYPLLVPCRPAAL